MKINYDAFLHWAEARFGDVVCTGQEVKINSPWQVDSKYHLWCNPDKNAYHCWKSGRHGNLFTLVAEIDHCSYRDAIARLAAPIELVGLETKVLDDIPKTPVYAYAGYQLTWQALPLPPYCEKLIDSTHAERLPAEAYLQARCLSSEGLYLCVQGKYARRIVIPYLAPDGTLVYWNARDYTDKQDLRYWGPSSANKRQVLFMTCWPRPGSRVYLTEGEFDAMSLAKCGLVGCALGGKVLNLEYYQVDMLRAYQVCLAFDADKYGKQALHKIGNDLLKQGLRNVTFCTPPVRYKDWNKMLVAEGSKIVAYYINANERTYDPFLGMVGLLT